MAKALVLGLAALILSIAGGMPSAALAASAGGQRQPTATEKADMAIHPSDGTGCLAILKQHPDAAHRWKFVGVCQSVIRAVAQTRCATTVPTLSGLYPGLYSTDKATREKAWSDFAKNTNWQKLTDPYNARLKAEWAKGDVPLGIPHRAPTLEQALKQVGCKAAFTDPAA